MSTLVSFSIDLEKMKKEKIVNGRWLNLTMSINDESNVYGQNVSIYHKQSKEEREAKVDRDYIGNGNVFWTDGNIVKAEQKQPEGMESKKDDDLPF